MQGKIHQHHPSHYVLKGSNMSETPLSILMHQYQFRFNKKVLKLKGTLINQQNIQHIEINKKKKH